MLLFCTDAPAAGATEPAEVDAPAAPETPAVSGVLHLEFGDESWVEIKDASGRMLHRQLNPAGSSVDIPGQPPFDVVIGNAAQARMTYNGRPIDLKPFIEATVARFTSKNARRMMSQIVRRPTRQVRVGHVPVGGDAPVVVQSMTNTDTADIPATVRQVQALAEAGSELVRLTVNTQEAAAAVPRIRERLDVLGCRVPLIGDFHFNGHKLLTAGAGMRRGAGQAAHQSRQRRARQQARRAVRHPDRGGLPATTSRCASASTGAASTRHCWRA